MKRESRMICLACTFVLGLIASTCLLRGNQVDLAEEYERFYFTRSWEEKHRILEEVFVLEKPGVTDFLVRQLNIMPYGDRRSAPATAVEDILLGKGAKGFLWVVENFERYSVVGRYRILFLLDRFGSGLVRTVCSYRFGECLESFEVFNALLGDMTETPPLGMELRTRHIISNCARGQFGCGILAIRLSKDVDLTEQEREAVSYGPHWLDKYLPADWSEEEKTFVLNGDEPKVEVVDEQGFKRKVPDASKRERYASLLRSWWESSAADDFRKTKKSILEAEPQDSELAARIESAIAKIRTIVDSCLPAQPREKVAAEEERFPSEEWEQLIKKYNPPEKNE